MRGAVVGGLRRPCCVEFLGRHSLLAIGRAGVLAASGRSDVALLECGPKRFERSVGIAVERTARDPNELPADAFKVALARHVRIESLGAVPSVAIAFDGELGVDSMYHKINAVRVLTNFHLGLDSVASFREAAEYSFLEWRVELMFFMGVHSTHGMADVREQTMAHALGLQVLSIHGVVDDKLILRSAHGDIEALHR